MQRFAFLLILVVLTTAALAESEVYISARTDGQDGTGTPADPFNGSTQQKFDGVLAKLGPGTTIHIGAGTFHTKGEASFKLQPNTKVRGAGMEVTKIIQDGTGKVSAIVFAGRADGVEIEDLSIDCGYQNQRVVDGKIKANVAAINLGGSHIAVRRCLVRNYGSPYDAETGENFAVFIGSPDPDNGENLVVEDCIFAGMSPLCAAGASVLTIAGGPPANTLEAGNWARGTVARRNHFTGYHYGCHGVTMSGAQGGIIADNVFEHFMGACVYQDTWPMRDIVIQNNIMSDVNQGIRLAGDNLDMNNFQIRNNILLVNDGYDLKCVEKGVAHTVIPHTFAVGNKIAFKGLKITDGKGLAGDCAYVTSIPSPSSFTYSLVRGGASDTADTAAGGFIQPLDYQGCMCPAPEAIVIFSGGGEKLHPPKNFAIDRNVIKSYSSDDSCRVRSTGILLQNLQHSLVTNNIVVDSGNHRDLLIVSTKGFSSSVICRDNYHPDLTPLMPRDGKLNIIPNGLLDLPLEAGRGIALMPNNGKIRIEATGIGAGATGEASAPTIARQVSPVGPAANHNSPGKPGDYALHSGYLYLYTGDGTAHEWKRIQLVDY
ncbi:MAG: hypothetical protein NTW87_11180 [Planctomycetota bacterium]|nr:hypothetical protein [Planctomycetota bacterium]